MLTLVFLIAQAGWTQEIRISDMRGDMGLLEDFGPSGCCWLNDGKILVSDRRYTVFHLFDREGRRYRFLEYPPKMAEANFSALCHWKDNRYLVTGSHYHRKNNTRIVEGRSVIHQLILKQEQLDPESGRDNYRPDTALRATGFYGESVDNPGEITGMALDPKQNRIFFGLDKCLAQDGTLVVLEGPLDKFLARSSDFDLRVVKTDLKPARDPISGTNYGLTDLAYLPGKGLVLLLSAQLPENDSLGSNQIWFMRAGFGPAKLAAKDIAPGNRASGICLQNRRESPDQYEAALVCDNNMEDSRIPSRLVILEGLRFPMR